jgi:DnaJ-class molecular chaperone
MTPRVIRTTEKFGPCFSCGGSGRIWQQYGGNSTTAPMTCSRCGGTGQIVTERIVETERCDG